MGFIRVVSLGQYIPMQTTMRTPYGNVHSTHYVYMPHIMNNGKSHVSAKSKYEFTVRLKNDSMFRVKSRIDISTNKHFITVKKDKQKINISPADTKSISHISKYNGYTIKGIPADSCWLFMVDKGKINSYSFIPD
ncbi:MAG TPA: hypothetical protein VL443_28235, partial [Cyclobacteriaceae bacterium]|nr:hypothetical protein [Cyclobacteriaceae bacterium]